MENRVVHRLALFLFAGAAFAQSGGTITGTVSDTEGVAFAKAPIQATNTATGAMFSAQSAADGGYTFEKLPAGDYDLLVAIPGMMPYQQRSVAVKAAQTLRLDIRVQDFRTLNTLGEGRDYVAALTATPAASSQPAPRTPDGKPDLSGVWAASLPSDFGKPDPLPWAAALTKERSANELKDAPGARCLPQGLMAGNFFPSRLVQTSALLLIVSEGDLVRQIFLDGRRHPQDPNPTWLGHSVGHWEGDTLVVDTAGFNDKSWLDLAGHPHTEMLHMIERYRRPDMGRLEIETTIDDPGAYSRPWTTKRISALAPSVEITEYVCNENNRDPAHMAGK